MQFKPTNSLYQNEKALSWKLNLEGADECEQKVSNFHESLSGYEPTPLKELPNSRDFGVHKVYVKEESSRFGLPSFKILGASWAVFKALISEFNLSDNATFAELKNYIESHKLNDTLFLVCATDGNHGRAVARMAFLLGINSKIYVPSNVLPTECAKIESEGKVNLIRIAGDYDEAVSEAHKFSLAADNRYFIQDTAFPGYTTIPQNIVQGYNTLLNEIDREVLERIGKKPALVVCGAGVGSFAQSVVSHYRAGFRGNSESQVMTVEPMTAHCCNKSLILNSPSICDEQPETTTIMDGLNCPTISHLSFPILHRGLSYSLLIDDFECHSAVEELKYLGIETGPCGAAPYAAFKKHFAELISGGKLNKTDTVVLISTEYKREYIIPSSYI